jgi:PAS domain S-box-containing protein
MQSKKVEYEIVPVYSSDAATVHWHEVYSYPIIDFDSGEVTGIIEFVRDVTQRKKAEKEKFDYLREFEVTLKGLGNIQVFRYRKNKDDQSVVTFSEGKIAESLSITTNQVKGKTLTEVMGEEYANKLKPYFSHAFAGKTVEYDFQSGERWFSTKLLPFETTSDGDVLEVIGASDEITERKKTEQSLKESEDKFKAIFEAVPDATFLANRTTGIIVDANHAAERLFETKLDNLIGRHQSQLHPTEQNEKAKHTFKYKSKHENELAPPVVIDIITAKNNRKNVEIRGQIVNIRDE